MDVQEFNSYGGICIVKTLAIDKLVYNTSVLTVPTNFAEKVNYICFKFIWNFKTDKIKRHTIIGPVDKGGLNMVDFNMVVKSLKAAWVKRLCEGDGNKWCSLFSSVTSQYGGRTIFDCNFDPHNLNFTSHMPKFYIEIFRLFGRNCTLRTLPQLKTTSMKLYGTTVL